MPKLERPPAYLHYVKDWLTSKAIRFMTLEEVAGYIFLLNEQWDTQDCTLPNDDGQLAELSRMREKWPASKETILQRFVGRKTPSRIYNVKLRRQWIERREYIKKCSDGGKNSAKSRKYKKKSIEGASKDLQGSFLTSLEGRTQGPMYSSSSYLNLKKEKEKEFNLQSKDNARKEGDHGGKQTNTENKPGSFEDIQAAEFLDRLRTGLKHGHRQDGFQSLTSSLNNGGEA